MNGWAKDVVSWKVGRTLYCSVPFTWLLPKAMLLAQAHKGPVEVGGPGAILRRDEIGWAEVRESCQYDALAMHNPLATFTTR
ncbi:MAG: hypothetical protein JRN42_08400, partial [Nitrososphaerota archaeon]|nr:hypothetical protein [Nitrososphaerota archaeon]